MPAKGARVAGYSHGAGWKATGMPVYSYPPPEPFDLMAAGWLTAAVAGAVTLVAWLLVHHLRDPARQAAARADLRRSRAETYLRIEELGAMVAGDAGVAERHATARALFDQATTAAAMAEVRAIAEEGIALAGDGEAS